MRFFVDGGTDVVQGEELDAPSASGFERPEREPLNFEPNQNTSRLRAMRFGETRHSRGEAGLDTEHAEE